MSRSAYQNGIIEVLFLKPLHGGQTLPAGLASEGRPPAESIAKMPQIRRRITLGVCADDRGKFAVRKQE